MAAPAATLSRPDPLSGLPADPAPSYAPATPPDYLVSANQRQYLAKLCWLLYDVATDVMRRAFDGFHPPVSLRQHLAQHHLRALLQKLCDQKVLSERQWRLLYPTKRRDVSGQTSASFDARLLAVLLQSVCHLSPPYPHGWAALPLPRDTSLSADVVRLQVYLYQVGSLSGVRHEEYPVLWKQIVEVLLRMGGPEVRVKIARIDQESLSPEEQTHFISLVKSSWGIPSEGASGSLRALAVGTLRARPSLRAHAKTRALSTKVVEDEEGLSAEDKAVLGRAHRSLCEGVQAEDVLDRLLQAHVIDLSERQEILTPARNIDRMQLLLAKILYSKQSAALRVLQDSLKFKYPLAHELLTKVRQVVQKEGVSDYVDVAAVCREGLANSYLSLLSRVTPLPWTPTQASIRDVYVPLDIVNEDGKKLTLGQILPAAVTSGRGRRVLVEGESGSGKSYLAAMLAYQWASHKSNFSTEFSFLVYLDARVVKGPLQMALHSLIFPDNFLVGPEEFWSLLETHSSETVFVVDGFEENPNHEELKQVIAGDKLPQACVLLTSRPEARASGWLRPDMRLYVLGLSETNIGRCLKSYAVLAQMTTDDYDVFQEVMSREDFPYRQHLSIPYVCLLVFGIYLSRGPASLTSGSNLTALFQHYLVAMATTFSRRVCPETRKGGQAEEVATEMLDAVSRLQLLAYTTGTSAGKLLSSADLENVSPFLRACVTDEQDPTGGDVTRASGQGEKQRKAGTGPGGSPAASKGQTSAHGLLSRWGFLQLAGRHSTGESSSADRWSFTCGLMRDFLAARHLADQDLSALEHEMEKEGLLRRPEWAQCAAFLCGLLVQGDGQKALAALFRGFTVQILKQSRRISLKDDSTGEKSCCQQGEGGTQNGVACHVTNFSQALQAVSECGLTPAGGPEMSEAVSKMVKALPRAVAVQGEEWGLIPRRCLQGLSVAVRSPAYRLSSLHVDLQPYHALQSAALRELAEAVSEGAALQELVVRWYSLPLLVTFLRSCLAAAPPLRSVVLRDCRRRPRARRRSPAKDGGAAASAGAPSVNASTWAGLQEVCALLRNAESFALTSCRAEPVVGQWIANLPDSIRALVFTGCAFNVISAADLGAKLQNSSCCRRLVLADTGLQSSEMATLFHDLQLNASLHDLSLAGCRLDRLPALALAECLRLHTSLRMLDLSRCHVTFEACQLLAEALRGNRSVVSIDLTAAEVEEGGLSVLRAARPDGQMQLIGVQGKYYS